MTTDTVTVNEYSLSEMIVDAAKILCGIEIQFYDAIDKAVKTPEFKKILKESSILIETLNSPEFQEQLQKLRDNFNASLESLVYSPQFQNFLELRPSDSWSKADSEQLISMTKEIMDAPPNDSVRIITEKLDNSWIQISDREKFIERIAEIILIILTEIHRTTSLPEIQNLTLFLQSILSIYLVLNVVHTSST